MATSSSWSKLPDDILSLIAHRLDSAVDRLRLRATCPAWRSSIPLPKLSPLPLTLPFYKIATDDLNPNDRPGSLHLFQSTIYCLHSLADDESDGNGLMIKVTETGAKTNCFVLLSRGINLLDYRVIKVCNSYSLKVVDRDDEKNLSSLKSFNRRVVVLGGWDAKIVVFLLRKCGSLQAWRKGDAEWTMIGGIGMYDDVLCWNGKCYAGNEAGEVVVFDEELRRVMRIENPMVCDSSMHCKYLVVWKGELYMVAQYMVKKTKFLKLNQTGDDWEHVDRLGEGAFFVAADVSFGFRARDFSGFKENSVYFVKNIYDFDRKD